MTHRERALAVLHYQPYDRMPCVSFGYWEETLDKWAAEGHIPAQLAEDYRRQGDNGAADRQIMAMLGFDFNWNSCIAANVLLDPPFPTEILEKFPDGQQLIRNGDGLLVRIKPGTVSIPSEVGTTLTGREAWEKLYLPRLQYHDGRINFQRLRQLPEVNEDGTPRALHLGSYIGNMRNLLGVEQFSYLLADDEDLYREIVDTLCNLAYTAAEKMLATGAHFDYAHFWEDICFKNGPLVIPSVFEEMVGPHYRKATELCHSYGIDIISLDCDGWIDKLIPIWLRSGVNTMFPIEVGTWNASIAPWREQYGLELRGVGGMDKRVFSRDKAAVDAEIERLRPLIALGGYIPCPDHRIPPDAKWDLVAYYCERFRAAF